MKGFHVLLALIFIGFLYAITIGIGGLTKQNSPENSVAMLQQPQAETKPAADEFWHAPNWATTESNPDAELIKYGKDLIANTSVYLGPKGSVAQISNGMNCQNCHLDAGTKVWGNNYSAVYATYPKFRERSGATETVAKRVNDCFERSLNGKALDTTSKEMTAIVAYIKWLGTDVNKGDKPYGSGITEVPYLDRAASPEKGKLVYDSKCANCHQANGEGILNGDKTAYQFPPLWGKHSYNDGAGLFRLSRFAGFVKSNMPLGASHNNTQLTDEEAWDVAAFVNSMPRPKKDITEDWPNIAGKPVDHPFGPFADKFSEQQHKFGPFKRIKEAKQKSTPSTSKL